MGVLKLIVLVLTLIGVTSARRVGQVLANPWFEQPIGPDNWVCNVCNGSLVQDSYRGRTSLKASARTEVWQGPSQFLPLKTKVTAGSYYLFTGYVKLLTSVPKKQPQTIKANLRYTYPNGSHYYEGVTARTGVVPEDGWLKIANEFMIFNETVAQVMFYISGPEAGVDFLVDSFSMRALESEESWRKRAEWRIKRLRKGDLDLVVIGRKKRSEVKAEIVQLTHEFGFGSAVDSETLKNNEKYRKWYMENFEWAVLENDFKWRQTELKEGQYTWEKADAAMKMLREDNKTVRGHSIFWANKERNPEWVQAITDPVTMYNTTMKRVDDLLGRYKGKLAHWDVNNEMLANSFYLDVYNKSNPKIRYDMFRKAHTVDPQAKLFLNDYNVVNSGQRTNMYIDQAKEFRAAGAPVHGMGVQSHLSGTPSGPVISSRLRRLAAARLPIWITELDYVHADHNTRAKVLQDALLAYFSHWRVKGVLFWGFWDGKHWKGKEAALVNGDDVEDNAAGAMWKQLFHKTWRTNATVQLRGPRFDRSRFNRSRFNKLRFGTRFRVRQGAFYGKYRVTIKTSDGSEVLATRDITLSRRTGGRNRRWRRPVFIKLD